MENVELLLRQLEDEILNARKTLIGNNIVVNADICNELLGRLRTALPTSIAQANSIIEDVEDIKQEAQRKAAEIIKEARMNVENMIKNSEIIRVATEEAENIKNQAVLQKDKADYAARRRVDELLETTENSIAEALMVIRNEREAIWGGIKKKVNP